MNRRQQLLVIWVQLLWTRTRSWNGERVYCLNKNLLDERIYCLNGGWIHQIIYCLNGSWIDERMHCLNRRWIDERTVPIKNCNQHLMLTKQQISKSTFYPLPSF